MRLNAKLKLVRASTDSDRDGRRRERRARAARSQHLPREDLLGFPLAAGLLTAAPAYRRGR